MNQEGKLNINNREKFTEKKYTTNSLKMHLYSGKKKKGGGTMWKGNLLKFIIEELTFVVLIKTLFCQGNIWKYYFVINSVTNGMQGNL